MAVVFESPVNLQSGSMYNVPCTGKGHQGRARTGAIDHYSPKITNLDFRLVRAIESGQSCNQKSVIANAL